MDDRLPVEKESLWWLAVSPTIWAVHFLASYVTVAIWCAKAAEADAPLGSARVAVMVYTAVALAGIVANGWRALARHRIGSATVPHDFDTREDRTRFIGFATFLLSLVSALAVVYVAMPFAYIGSCG